MALHDCRLGDAGLAPVLLALGGNHHLRSLSLQGNGMTAAFAHDRLLPALRANTGLWQLETDGLDADDTAAVAQILAVNARRRR